MGKDIMKRICNKLRISPYEFFMDEKTPVLVDEEEKHVIRLFREAERLGVADQIEKFGEYLVADSKRKKLTEDRKPLKRKKVL